MSLYSNQLFTIRPRSRVLAGALIMLLAGMWLINFSAAPGADAASSLSAASRPQIDVVEIEGMLDPVNASLMAGVIRDAERANSVLVVLRVDSPGVLDVDVDELVGAVKRSRVPVAVWIGPTGASARRGAALVARAAHVLAIAPGAHIDVDGRSLGAQEASRRKIADLISPSVGEVIVELDERVITTTAGQVELDTATVKETKNGPRREPNSNTDVRFSKLGLGARLQHAFMSPSIALFMLFVGLCLVVFEFFTAGIGLAGAVGALALVGSSYGFSHLPVNWWALALIVVGLIGFSIDVQAGVLAFWTVVGVVFTFIGAISLYGGSSQLDPPLWMAFAITGGVVLFMLAGMTSVVRARFSTPTIGRESMIGEMGEATTDVRPDGIVRVRGAVWKARTNRATPISISDSIRVVAVDGLVLEVEPEEGGARDAGH